MTFFSVDPAGAYLGFAFYVLIGLLLGGCIFALMRFPQFRREPTATRDGALPATLPQLVAQNLGDLLGHRGKLGLGHEGSLTPRGSGRRED